MVRILIVDDFEPQRKLVRHLLERAGYTCDLACDGRDALDAIGRQMPDAIVTDMQMPNMDGFELLEEIKSRGHRMPVILMTAAGDDQLAVKALRAGAASYVAKRVIRDVLVSTVEEVLGSVQQAGEVQRWRARVQQLSIAAALDNDESLIPALVNDVKDMNRRVGLLDERRELQVCIALREALVNAIQHGNLEVSSELRQEDERIFHAELDRRRPLEPYTRRKVYFSGLIGRNSARFVIRDEGPGFDPSKLPDPLDPENLERIGGRGMMLIQSFFDLVSFNSVGNEITLVKFRS